MSVAAFDRIQLVASLVKETTQIDPHKEKGFALILSLSLLSFLALLSLALVSVIGVEVRVAEAIGNRQVAREHAKVAMRIALGELKKHLGPDQRITARSDFIETDTDQLADGKRHWTGVWESQDPTAEPVWLVSGDLPDPYGSSEDEPSASMVQGTENTAKDDRALRKILRIHFPDSVTIELSLRNLN